MTTQYLSKEDLLQTTVQGLQNDLTQLAPALTGLIMQWSHTFGQTDGDFDRIGIKLSELQDAVTLGRAPQIAEVLHSLSKLTREVAPNDQGLTELANALSDAAGRVAQM
jgi:ABC-type transporter Mla subunit MlaD